MAEASASDIVPAPAADVSDSEQDMDTMCAICQEAPRGVVLLACGHSILCAGCFHALSAQPPERAVCPLCRAKLAPIALPLPPGETRAVMPMQARLELMFPVLECIYTGDATLADGDIIVAASAPSDARVRCLATLNAFAAHTNEQCWEALRECSLEVACGALKNAPLNAALQAACVALVTTLVAVTCGKIDDRTGVVCTCTPQSLSEECIKRCAFQLAVVQPLRAFAACSGAGRDVILAACIAAQVMLSRSLVPPRSGKALNALARTLLHSVLPALTAADDYIDDEEALEAALQALHMLALRKVRAARTPEAATAATRVLDVAVARIYDHLSQNVRGTYAALQYLETFIYSAPNKAMSAACVRAAADAGAARALLRFMRIKGNCACPNCADCLAGAVLPLLQAVCASSPSALRAALDNNPPLMMTVSNTAASFMHFSIVTAASFRVVTAALKPPALDNGGDEVAWRGACAAAAAAVVSEKIYLLNNAITFVVKSPVLLPPYNDELRVNDGLSGGGHALLFLAALAEHHGDVTAHWLTTKAAAAPGVVECVLVVDNLLLKHPVAADSASTNAAVAAVSEAALAKVHAAAATLLVALLQHPQAAGVAVATSRARDASLRMLRLALAGQSDCSAAAGAACMNMVRFALAGGARTLRQVCASGAVGEMLLFALEQPWQPALRRCAPIALALIMALLAAGCAEGEDEQEKEDEGEQAAGEQQ